MNYSNQPPLPQKPTPTILLAAHDEMKEALLALVRKRVAFLAGCSVTTASEDSVGMALGSGFPITVQDSPGL